MKFLLAFLAFAAPVFADEIAEWDVVVDSVQTQGITFTTGAGGGTNPNLVLKVYDICRLDGPTQDFVGDLYPTPSVDGIGVNAASVDANPGTQDVIVIDFEEGIAQNSKIYEDASGNNAKVEFCVEIGIYDVDDLINFAEVKLIYNIDLDTEFTSLDGYVVTQAKMSTNQTKAIEFDGDLDSYFCNPTSHVENANDASITTQGNLISVCFRTFDGQFEVEDVLDLTIENVANGGTPEQSIMAGGSILSATTPYAEKTCTDDTDDDTNVCVVTFLLKAAFFAYDDLTLTGHGNILLEFGDATNDGARRNLRALQKGQTQEAPFMVKPGHFKVIKDNDSSATMASIAAIGALAGAVLAI